MRIFTTVSVALLLVALLCASQLYGQPISQTSLRPHHADSHLLDADSPPLGSPTDHLPPETGWLVALVRERDGELLADRTSSRLISARHRIWRVSGVGAETLISELERAGALRYVEPDVRSLRFKSHGEGGDPLLPEQWWFTSIGADRVEPPDRGVPLIVIDDGFDPSHPEFRDRQQKLLNARHIGPFETHFHGMAVSSVAAAPANGVGIVGVYPKANFWYWDIRRDFPRCSDAVAAIDAVTRTPRKAVINISWGFPPNQCSALREAIQGAFGVGYLIVAAAGNERALGSPETSPANLSHVLTVAATNQKDRPTFFSTKGLGIDLAAPGKSIIAAVRFDQHASGYQALSGTSFAAPMVSAAAAWVWKRRPGLDVTQLFDLLRLSARDAGSRGWDRNTGFGVLDIPNALTRTPPRRDPGEPNDDIDEVKANGLFKRAAKALVGRSQRRAAISARLDWSEDPIDVYRVWIPAGRRLSVRLAPTANVDLEVFAPKARTVFYESQSKALRRGSLIAFSDRRGARREQLTVTNTGKRGEFFYVTAFIPGGKALRASYTLKAVIR